MPFKGNIGSTKVDVIVSDAIDSDNLFLGFSIEESELGNCEKVLDKMIEEGEADIAAGLVHSTEEVFKEIHIYFIE